MNPPKSTTITITWAGDASDVADAFALLRCALDRCGDDVEDIDDELGISANAPRPDSMNGECSRIERLVELAQAVTTIVENCDVPDIELDDDILDGLTVEVVHARRVGGAP